LGILEAIANLDSVLLLEQAKQEVEAMILGDKEGEIL
jgi:hypothetical protein